MDLTLFHITDDRQWPCAGEHYLPNTYSVDGFVHCSTAKQVLATAQRYFQGRDDLILLAINTTMIEADIRYENLIGGSELFPHIYGPIPCNAIESAEPLQRGADNEYLAPKMLHRG
ncbi:MAG: DUF952 domain-containing protein [Gammaproteobacteria bacterium]|nr:DUF952 domain-containing protein [Gammaproteobacteria bacterium]